MVLSSGTAGLHLAVKLATLKYNLLIVGAGDYGQIAHEIAEAMGVFEKIDFLDDKNDIAIGKVSEIEKYSGEYSYSSDWKC